MGVVINDPGLQKSTVVVGWVCFFYRIRAGSTYCSNGKEGRSEISGSALASPPPFVCADAGLFFLHRFFFASPPPPLPPPPPSSPSVNALLLLSFDAGATLQSGGGGDQANEEGLRGSSKKKIHTQRGPQHDRGKVCQTEVDGDYRLMPARKEWDAKSPRYSDLDGRGRPSALSLMYATV